MRFAMPEVRLHESTSALEACLKPSLRRAWPCKSVSSCSHRRSRVNRPAPFFGAVAKCTMVPTLTTWMVLLLLRDAAMDRYLQWVPGMLCTTLDGSHISRVNIVLIALTSPEHGHDDGDGTSTSPGDAEAWEGVRNVSLACPASHDAAS